MPVVVSRASLRVLFESPPRSTCSRAGILRNGRRACHRYAIASPSLSTPSDVVSSVAHFCCPPVHRRKHTTARIASAKPAHSALTAAWIGVRSSLIVRPRVAKAAQCASNQLRLPLASTQSRGSHTQPVRRALWCTNQLPSYNSAHRCEPWCQKANCRKSTCSGCRFCEELGDAVACASELRNDVEFEECASWCSEGFSSAHCKCVMRSFTLVACWRLIGSCGVFSKNPLLCADPNGGRALSGVLLIPPTSHRAEVTRRP